MGPAPRHPDRRTAGFLAYPPGTVAAHRNAPKPRRASPRPAAPETPPPPLGRADGLTAAVLGAGALALFVVTLCPTIYVEDSAEFSTAAAVLGVPHPPGYPFYTLLAAIFVRLVRLGDMGYRANLFSAACGAATVAALWILLRRLRVSRASALAATLCFALGTTFWSQCVAAEVHALNCLLLVLSLLASFRAAEAPSLRGFVVAGLLLGLLVGHRNLNILFAAPLVVLLESARRREGGGRHWMLWLAAAAAATTLVYLYLPTAALRDPPLNIGAPSTWPRFVTVVTAHSYFRHLATTSAALSARRLLQFLARLPVDLGVALVAVPVGFLAGRRRAGPGRLPVAVLACIAAACIAFAALYNVLDIEAYFLPALLALAVVAAFGFEAFPPRWRRVAPVAALAVLPFNWGTVNLRHMDLGRTYERDLLASAPPGAIVLSFGDTATHALWYGQAVERARPDVAVISIDEISDWYLEQLARARPDLSWPTVAEGSEWLRDFIRDNLSEHPVCLTEPLNVGLPGLVRSPEGLLYCLRPRLEPAALSTSIAFWSQARIPAAPEVAGADLHVKMLAFSYAKARFALAAALAQIGDRAAARTQLAPVAAADPDAVEQAITDSIRAIGHVRAQLFSLGARARQAAALDAQDPALGPLLQF